MTAITLPRYQASFGVRFRRRLLVVAAVGQAVSSTLASFFGNTFTIPDRPDEPPIVPPGGSFVIWGAIVALSIGYAIWAESDRRPDPELRDQLTRPLLIVCIGFSLWLAAAELEPNWTTLVIFLLMFVALLRATAYAIRRRAAIQAWGRFPRALLWGTLGLYLGWTSVAVWLNLTTGLVGSGAPTTSPVAILGQAAILAGATGTAMIITWYTRALLPYVAAVAWALAGVIISTIQEGYPALAITAAVGLALVLTTAVLARRRLRSVGTQGFATGGRRVRR